MGWKTYHKYPRTLGTHLTGNVQRKKPHTKRRKKPHSNMDRPEETDTDPGWVTPQRAAEVLVPDAPPVIGKRLLCRMAVAGVYEFGLHWVWAGPYSTPGMTPTRDSRMRRYCLMQIQRDKLLLDQRRHAYDAIGHTRYVAECGTQQR